jgi:hypothetical protein
LANGDVVAARRIAIERLPYRDVIVSYRVVTKRAYADCLVANACRIEVEGLIAKRVLYVPIVLV